MMQNLKKFLRRLLSPEPLAETEKIRELIALGQRPDFPYCPFWQGDFIYRLCRSNNFTSVLEIGFATGSTALYLLSGTGDSGSVVSIDFKQDEFERMGCRKVALSPWKDRHLLFEENSNIVLPRLFAEGKKFDLIFLDGWKTVDHMVMDVYYSARLLRVGGLLVFDDTRMRAVRRVIKLLVSHYAFREVDYTEFGENIKMWLWFRATTKSFMRPYRAFRKVKNEAEWPACMSYQFYSRF